MAKRSKRKLKLCRVFVFIFILLICYIVLKHRNNNYINSIIMFDKIYLSINEEYNLTNDEKIKYDILNESIFKLDNNILTGLSSGSGTLEVRYLLGKKKVNIIVSDLYSLPELNNEKEYLPCGKYSKEDNMLLDNALKFNIDKVSYKTRAAVVEAARFLILRFNYKLNYFVENGRLNNYGNKTYVDAEGRYYHTGLYLNSYKFDEIKASLYGPVIWGCPLQSKLYGDMRTNGIDCSGYVSWAILNGGFDIGDSGSGYNDFRSDDLDDFGERVKITMDFLESKKLKPGDLITRDGHIGIIIGIEEDKIHVADAFDLDLHTHSYTYQELVDTTDWTTLHLMDSVYKEDGNLTYMW